MSIRSMFAGALALSVTLFAGAPVSASATYGGHVTLIAPNVDGTLAVYLDVAGAGRPACATLDRWGLNVSTLAGQSVAASIYMAMAAGMKVDIIGTGTCDVLGGSESISYVLIHK